MSTVTRRTALKLSAAAAFVPALPVVSLADPAPQHALTVFGAPKHGPDFTHFDYVNPDAPKGGSMRMTPSAFGYNQNPTTFDTFNMLI